MIRGVTALLLLFSASASAGYRVESMAPLPVSLSEDAGQVADPRPSPDGAHVSFEIMGRDGATLQVWVGEFEVRGGELAGSGEVTPVLPTAERDPFTLAGSVGGAVSEHLSWGPPKRGEPRVVVAATRKAAHLGASQINFDLYLFERGRRRFLTEHPGNDAHPAFRSDGEYVAFATGRTGQGDIFLYHFFATAEPLIQVTYESAGSEMFPSWSPTGEKLAFVGHLGGDDHIYVVNDVDRLAKAPPPRRRQLAKQMTVDLTPGWRVSCLAPSFSPDGNWLAFYAKEQAGDRADLFVIPTAGGEPRRLLQGGIPETRGGPRWSPDGRGLFAVIEDADRLNPLVWAPVAADGQPMVLPTGTELNADPYPFAREQQLFLLFTAQGSADRAEKRWRRIYAARLRWEN